jgi:hypothetical protein
MTKASNIKAALCIPKNSLIASFLVANAFVWYISAFRYLQLSSDANGYGLLPVVAANLTALFISAYAASLKPRWIKNRLTFLKYWIAAGVLLSIPFAVLNMTDFYTLNAMSALVGVYFGFGIPACMAYFAKETQPQNRAKASGLIMLLGIGYTIISLVGTSAVIIAAVLAVWRATSLLPLIKAKSANDQAIEKKVTYRSVISNRALILYAIPWLMFSLIDGLTLNLNNAYFNSAGFPAFFSQNYVLIESIFSSASAIACGVIADKKGRKRLALVAFVMLGISYAMLGLLSGQFAAALFYVCVYGFVWAAFSLLFLFTVWGDIAQERGAEKFYFVGVLPYLFSNFIRILLAQSIGGGVGAETVVFSFASFFLFLAILPLAYAPETLPDKVMKKAELDNYIEKALEKVQKENSA